MKKNKRNIKNKTRRKKRLVRRIKLLVKFVCIVFGGLAVGAAIPVVVAVSRGEWHATAEVAAYAEDGKNGDIAFQESSLLDDKIGQEKEKDKTDKLANLEPIPKVDEEYLILVNKEHRIPEDYEVELEDLKNGGRYVDARIADEVEAFTEAAEDAGMYVQVISGYRDIAKQQRLVDEDVERYMEQGMTWRDAYKETMKYTMPAGYSEHHTGLAVDIVSLHYLGLDDKQATQKENMWLRKHCAEYGFILRYPLGKEDITGVCYESWHFRYVGVEAATYITENDLTFEEFMELYEMQA